MKEMTKSKKDSFQKIVISYPSRKKHKKSSNHQKTHANETKAKKNSVEENPTFTKRPNIFFSFFAKLKKTFFKRSFVYFLVICMFFSLSFYVVMGNFNPNLTNSTADDDKSNPADIKDIHIKDFSTDYYEKNTLKWKMIANEAGVFQAQDLTELSDVKLEYFEKGEATTKINADSSVIQNTSKNITLKGNVIMKNKKGTVAKGESFFYNNKTGILSSKERVTIIRGDGFIISGVGFSANKDLENIIFSSEVRGKVPEESATSGGFDLNLTD